MFLIHTLTGFVNGLEVLYHFMAWFGEGGDEEIGTATRFDVVIVTVVDA